MIIKLIAQSYGRYLNSFTILKLDILQLRVSWCKNTQQKEANPKKLQKRPFIDFCLSQRGMYIHDNLLQDKHGNMEIGNTHAIIIITT